MEKEEKNQPRSSSPTPTPRFSPPSGAAAAGTRRRRASGRRHRLPSGASPSGSSSSHPCARGQRKEPAAGKASFDEQNTNAERAEAEESKGEGQGQRQGLTGSRRRRGGGAHLVGRHGHDGSGGQRVLRADAQHPPHRASRDTGKGTGQTTTMAGSRVSRSLLANG